MAGTSLSFSVSFASHLGENFLIKLHIGKTYGILDACPHKLRRDLENAGACSRMNYLNFVSNAVVFAIFLPLIWSELHAEFG